MMQYIPGSHDADLQSMGGVFFGWIAMNLGIRWCYWVSFLRLLTNVSLLIEQIQAILGGFSCVLNALYLRETRSDVLLSRRAKRLTKSTGRLHLCAADLQKQSFSTLLSVSVVRPLSTSFAPSHREARLIIRISRYRADRHCPFGLDRVRLGVCLFGRYIGTVGVSAV